jgi:predicted transcriptional regulator
MQKKVYDLLTNKCKNIVENNTPVESINKLSTIYFPGTKKRIGKENAFKIYKLCSKYSVKYTIEEYGNNIREYNKKIMNNLKEAERYSKV